MIDLGRLWSTWVDCCLCERDPGWLDEMDWSLRRPLTPPNRSMRLQHECIPQAILGMDVICQAKSGMGKTAVFVISTLQQLEPVDGQVAVLILCHTRELAFQICHEYERFTTYMKNVRVGNFFGGLPVKQHREMLKDPSKCPHVIVGTPGRIKALAEEKSLDLTHLRHFVVDECDKCLESIDMRADVQAIFKKTPHDKQVMMFSATLSAEVRPVCKKFMRDPMEIYVDDESKLTLHGLVQHYVMLQEEQKNRKLNDLLDALDFNQVVIFVKSVARARELNRLLNECNFPSTTIHAGMQQAERLKVYKEFKEGAKRILVATDLVGRGIDIERVNIVLNYDMPETDEKHGNGADSYLHRVGRAGRFGTKGLAITFVSGMWSTRRFPGNVVFFSVPTLPRCPVTPSLPHSLTHRVFVKYPRTGGLGSSQLCPGEVRRQHHRAAGHDRPIDIHEQCLILHTAERRAV